MFLILEQCQEFQGNIASETENEISNSEDEESNPETESENEESPKSENQFWKREARAISSSNQMKLRDHSQEKERPQQPDIFLNQRTWSKKQWTHYNVTWFFKAL